MTTTTETKVFVFWTYDIFPYVLGAPAKLLPDGGFQPDGYGCMTWGRSAVVAIYPLEIGAEIKAKLESEKAKCRATVDQAYKDGMKAANKILPELHGYRVSKKQAPN